MFGIFRRRWDYRRSRRRLPTIAQGVGPPAGPQVKRLHPVPKVEAFVVRPNYERRRLLSPQVFSFGTVLNLDWWGPSLHRHGQHMGYVRP